MRIYFHIYFRISSFMCSKRKPCKKTRRCSKNFPCLDRIGPFEEDYDDEVMGSTSSTVHDLQVTINRQHRALEDAWEGDADHALFVVRHVRGRFGYQPQMADAFKANRAHYAYCEKWYPEMLVEDGRPLSMHRVGTDFEAKWLTSAAFNSGYRNRVNLSRYRLIRTDVGYEVQWLDKSDIESTFALLAMAPVPHRESYVDEHGVLITEVDI